jgi:hypothetical protein
VIAGEVMVAAVSVVMAGMVRRMRA